MKAFKSNMQLGAVCAMTALFLAGCAGDNLFADDDIYAPNSGSKAYPIKVANGKAFVEPCGVWLDDAGDTTRNELMSNHGCAVQTNIAAMTANPNDLIGAVPPAPPLGDIQYTAIKKITEPATQ